MMYKYIINRRLGAIFIKESNSLYTAKMLFEIAQKTFKEIKEQDFRIERHDGKIVPAFTGYTAAFFYLTANEIRMNILGSDRIATYEWTLVNMGIDESIFKIYSPWR